MNWTTQMDAARKGVRTKQMQEVAQKEGVDCAWLMERIASGKIVVPANKNHSGLSAAGIGEGMKTKINVNLGISKDCHDTDLEISKASKALELGTDAIMDLSSCGKTQEFRRKLVTLSPAMIGTVPVYDAVGFYEKELKDITDQEFIDVVRVHAKDGVDFMTLHAGINRETARRFKANKRLTHIVSRGGSLLYLWMELTGRENPFFARFDEILDICAEYDVTISLGDACRPGSLHDSTDASQVEELIVLGELTKRAWARNVQVMIEGPGHMAINEIAANMLLEKRLCYGAPFYVLGPIVTDVAPGYDHITSAIGGAIAAANGADFLCYVTPAEHLRLPSLDDMKDGIVATKIAAHAADIAKGVRGARDWDDKMSKARADLNWDAMFTLAMDPEKPRRYREESRPEFEDSCTMCGRICAMRSMKKLLEGEDVSVQ